VEEWDTRRFSKIHYEGLILIKLVQAALNLSPLLVFLFNIWIMLP
jgi:hypothetical protein